MKGRNLLGLAFRVIGLAFVVVAAVAAAFALAFVLRAEPLTGVVVGHSTVQNAISILPDSGSTGILYYPVISYRDTGGTTREFTGPRGSSSPRFLAGEIVPVLMSRTNPRDVRLASVMGVWGTAIVLGTVAAIFVLLGFLAPFGFGGLGKPGL